MNLLLVKGFAALMFIFFLTNCGQFQKDEPLTYAEILRKQDPWIKTMNQEVAKLGAGNWIVVAESAYPTPKDSSIKVIAVDASVPEVLYELFETFEAEGHVWSKIYTLREFEHLKEKITPGIQNFKSARTKAINDRKKQEITSEVAKLLFQSSSKEYRSLLIKTNSNIPYSSVFLELETGYWDRESEQKMRKSLKSE